MQYIHSVQSKDKTKYAVVINHAPGITVLHEAPTEAEAVEAYRQSLLPRWQSFTTDDEQHRCDVCGKWTSSYAMISETAWSSWLCGEHETDETIDKLFTLPVPLEVWTS